MSRLGRIIFFAIQLVILGSTAGICYAEMYKWVDAEGVTHYESRPPEWAGAEITSVRVKRTEAQTVQKRLDRADEMQAAVETREQQEAESSAEQQQWNEDVATQRTANCKTAQERLNAYNTAHRLYRELGDGEREYLDDDQTDTARADAHNLVNEWCDNS